MGDDDRIHGYNAVYRNEEQQKPNLYAFIPKGNKPNIPDKFHNIKVNVQGMNIYDHQGHIVPQNLLGLVLANVVNIMDGCKEDTDFNAFFEQHNEYPWLKQVYDYGQKTKAPMFEWDKAVAQDRLNGFLSIVVWNPINICRAPEDKERGGKPGNTIDLPVIDYLKSHKAELGLNEGWLQALEAVNAEDIGSINAYIGVCSATLEGQRAEGAGYYSFPWEKDGVKLKPAGVNLLNFPNF
jgi:hypothetical protein